MDEKRKDDFCCEEILEEYEIGELVMMFVVSGCVCMI
jgi:hypothetical protein